MNNINLGDIFDKEYEKVNKMRPNILVVGKTGVGKSTLINAVFSENIAETGVGNPVSQNLVKYEKEGIPVSIWDTRGLELKEEAQAQTKQAVLDEIRNLKKDNDITKQINVCWYCINYLSKRIEETEIEWIKQIAEEIPVIIVLTQTQSLKDDEFYKEIRLINMPVKQVVRVLAEPFYLDEDMIIQPRGLKELSDVTFQILPEQLRKAYIAAQTVDLSKKIKIAWLAAGTAITGSAAAAFLPPGADLAAVASAQAAMLASITVIFGLGFGKKFFVSVIAGVGSRAGITAGVAYFFGSLSKATGVGYVAASGIEAAVNIGIATTLAVAYINVCSRVVSGKLENKTEKEIIDIFNEEFVHQRTQKNPTPDGLV